MGVFHNQGRWDASNTDVEGDLVVRYEKASRDERLAWIDYGATALRREVIAALPADQPAGLDAVQSDLARRRRLRALVVRERFWEIGSEQGLAELDRELQGKS